MRIDLHTHSRASDGTQTPGELVRAAYAAGIDVLALTDHDTADGWDEAAEAAVEVGITLVRGMEISTELRGRAVHLLGYLPDPTYPPLARALQRILDGRNDRVPRILDALRDAEGIDLDAVEVRRLAGEPAATGRPHVADALVATGQAADRDDAFERLLGPGRAGYVRKYAEPVADMVRLVGEAGGVCVVAHPWGRGSREAMTSADLAGLRDAGLAGIEVDHQEHDARDRADLRAVARELDLVVTGSSDHHGQGKVDHELGCNTTDPEQYRRLLDLASVAARASGRPVPAVLGPVA
ncbi:PHP domain-containing protein [Nocardioides donggukensis]|uniref:PHP domain-containing protein n=1 Tax=Nocardioides donggukensis TaxID=2774019 RepID=A0A927K756_9ACTN|nr:PHP domain-containing protein [Nocardioides donggukensis]MBD8870248.1 PHP domain-containing protein [Nocardioides donggukensis]